MGLKNAIVLGGGIGGLAAATALGQRGVSVTVLEQAPELGEVGAGLQISPNGFAVLRSLGLAAAIEAKSERVGAVILREDRRGAVVARLPVARLRPDQPYLAMHRADLVAVLANAAMRAGVRIETGSQVASVRPGEPPQVQLSGGATRKAELIVAADGIHSVARPVLNGPDAAQFSGQVAWRALVPNTCDHPDEVQVAMGPGRHLVSYPLRGGTMVNLVGVEERDAWAAEGWQHRDDPAHLAAAFEGFGGNVPALMQAVLRARVSLWGLHLHPVADTWIAPGIALVGDAAHPTLPFLAQGANLALEDAWVLADACGAGDLSAGLAAYQNRRIARVRRVIRTARGNAWRYHLRPGPVRTFCHLGLRMVSTVTPSLMLRAFDWLYDHDVTAGSGGRS